MAIFIFRSFGLKLNIPVHFQLGIFSQNVATHHSSPWMDHPCAETGHLSHKAWRSVQWFELCAGSRKRTGQSKKLQSSNILPIWGEAPTVPIETKIWVGGHLADIITFAAFQDDTFRAYYFTVGQISHFPIDFCMGLTTVQHYCAACDKIIRMSWYCDSWKYSQ